jgi:carboxyl-terminal processing protease
VTSRFLAFLWVLASACAGAFAADARTAQREDFDALWRAIDTRYVYFEGRRAQWRHAREDWRAKAAAARSRNEFLAALEGAIAALHDDHVTLSEASAASPRRIPMESDLWAAWKNGAAVIESVRYAGDADYAGVHPGDVVTHVDNVPVERATARLVSRHAPAPSDATRDWALRHALAGPRRGAFALTLGGREPRRVEIARDGRPHSLAPALLARRMGEERDVGYVHLRNLADTSLPRQLDAALAQMADARALIVDLRDAGAGSREVTLAVLARLAKREGPWQLREGRDGKRDADRVTPSAAAPWKAPLVLLVDRWTAGEGEALAAGLAAVAGARMVGTPMAGLRGELHAVKLPHSGVVLRFPAERTFTPDGTPREAIRPDVAVDPTAPNGGPGDPILYQALKLLEK